MRLKQILSESVTKRPWTFYHGTKSDGFDQFNPQAATKGEQHWNPLGDGMYATNNPSFASNFGSKVYKVIIPAGSSYKRINLRTWQWTIGPSLVFGALKIAFKAVGENLEHWEKGAPVTPPGDARKMSREQIVAGLVDYYLKDPYNKTPKDEIISATEQHDTEKLRGYLVNVWSRIPRTRDEGKARKLSDFRIDVGRTLTSHDPYTGIYECSYLVLDFGQQYYEAFCTALPRLSNAKFKKYDFIVFTETNDVMGFTDTESTSEVVIFNPALQRTSPVEPS